MNDRDVTIKRLASNALSGVLCGMANAAGSTIVALLIWWIQR
ncbi:hypothetical protein ACRYCC_28090 [Actinomadura scrupuli]